MKNRVLEYLSRLLPKRVAARPALEVTERMRILAEVPENSPTVKALTDQLMEMLEGEFLVAIDPQRSDMERLRACEGLRVAYWMVHKFEKEREDAKAWAKQEAANRQRDQRDAGPN